MAIIDCKAFTSAVWCICKNRNWCGAIKPYREPDVEGCMQILWMLQSISSDGGIEATMLPWIALQACIAWRYDGTEIDVERCRFCIMMAPQLSQLAFVVRSRTEAGDAVCGIHCNMMVRQLSQLAFVVRSRTEAGVERCRLRHSLEYNDSATVTIAVLCAQ